MVGKFVKANGYFLLAFVLIVVLRCLLYPSLTIFPEVFQDGASNFLNRAVVTVWYKNLPLPDAGYLPFFQRILALIAVKLVPIKFANYSLQWLSNFFAIFFIASLNFKAWRTILKSDLIRFLLSILFALYNCYNVFVLENFVTFGGIFALWAILVDKSSLSKTAYVSLILFSMAVLPSKPHLVGFLPAYGLLFIYFRLKKSPKEYYYYLGCIASLLVQCLYLIRVRLIGRLWQGDSTLSVLGYIKTILYALYDRTLAIFITPFIDTLLPYKIALSVFFVLFMLLGLYIGFRKRNWKAIGLMAVLILVILTNEVLNAVAMGKYSQALVWPESHYLLIDMFFVLLFVVSTLQAFRSKVLELVWVILLFCLIVTNIVKFPSKTRDLLMDRQQSFSKWSAYYKLVKNKEFGIPANTENANTYWLIGNGVSYVNADVGYGTNLKPLAKDTAKWLKTGTTCKLVAVIVDLADQSLWSQNIVLHTNTNQRITSLTPTNYRYRYYLLDKVSLSAIKLYSLSFNANINPSCYKVLLLKKDGA